MKRIRQKQYKIGMGVLLLLLMLLFMPLQTAWAASATITLSTDTSEIHVGDTVEIKLTVKADATIGDVEAFITYDDSILEFYSSVSCITGGAGRLKVSDIGASPSEQDRTYRIYFKAVAQGDCEVAMYDRPVIYGYSDGKEMSVTGISKMFTVLPANDASSDCSLSVLHLIDNRTSTTTVALTPAFSPEETMYYASVPYEAEWLIVSAISNDEKAEVEIAGESDLYPGNNEVLITVTAENGTRNVYTIHVYRAEEPTKEQPPEEELPEIKEELPIQGIVLEQTEEAVLVTEYHSYTVAEKPEELQVPDGYVPTVLLLNGISVPAYARADSPDFLLLVLKNTVGETSWYRYDRLEQTLQRLTEEEFVITQIVESSEEQLQEAIMQYKVQQTGLFIGLSLVSGLCFVLLMVILWLCIRRKNQE